MFNPPDGCVDMLADAELSTNNGPFLDLEVPDVGVVRARRPMPNAAANLAMSENSKIAGAARLEHRTRFLRNHLADGEHERLTAAMMTDDLPYDTMERVTRAVAVWGTARPTLPSSASR
jgi:hypothetical protein